MYFVKFTSELSEELKFKNYSERTIESYCWHLRQFLIHFKDKDHPRNISSVEIKSYLKMSKSVSELKQRISAIKFFYKNIIQQPLTQIYTHIPPHIIAQSGSPLQQLSV